MGLVVITDLDGTLLDHQTYSYAPALPALNLLQEKNIPLILCSSKTRAELMVLWNELGLTHPFISENGGGVFAPPDYPLAKGKDWEKFSDNWLVHRIGKPVKYVRKSFAEFKDEFKAQGFSDLTDENVAELTGLSLEKAKLARQREFNEPVVLPNKQANFQTFALKAAEYGLQVTQGGRFVHLLGGGDKGLAVSFLSSLFREKDSDLVTMALGDAFNDLPMFKKAQLSVLVAKKDLTHAPIDLPGLIKEPCAGPLGFNRAVLKALEIF